jgi:hypothetical protein
MTTRSALAICEEYTETRNRLNQLDAECQIAWGKTCSEFIDGMRQLLDGGISIELVRIGSDGEPVDRQDVTDEFLNAGGRL